MVLHNFNCPVGENIIHHNIISMAQNYIGSNNINILQPIGQFGTRQMGGKDSAPARHLSTCTHKLTLLLFPEDD